MVLARAFSISSAHKDLPTLEKFSCLPNYIKALFVYLVKRPRLLDAPNIKLAKVANSQNFIWSQK